MIDYIRKYWIPLWGLLFGFIGIVLALYFYALSAKQKTPIFQVSRQRTLIADSKQTRGSKIRVVDKDGNEIQGQIWVVTFYFWNAGKLSIKKAQILEDLQIEFKSKEIKILDSKIINQTRPKIIKASLGSLLTYDPQKVRLEFDILEHGDGVSGQITYIGSQNAEISLSGTIEGVKEFYETAPVDWSMIWLNLFKVVVGGAVLIFIFFLIDFIPKKLRDLFYKLVPDEYVKSIERIYSIASKLAWVIAIAGFLFLLAYVMSRYETPLKTDKVRIEQVNKQLTN
jgi:hypothetical protein